MLLKKHAYNTRLPEFSLGYQRKINLYTVSTGINTKYPCLERLPKTTATQKQEIVRELTTIYEINDILLLDMTVVFTITYSTPS